MKKWLIRALFLITMFMAGIGIYLFIELQPVKHDVIYSPSAKYLIYQHYGDEHQPLPYASVVYVEEDSIFSFFKAKQPVMMGYCTFEYKWLSDTDVKILCIANNNNNVIKTENKLGIKVLYEVRSPID